MLHSRRHLVIMYLWLRLKGDRLWEGTGRFIDLGLVDRHLADLEGLVGLGFL